MSRVGSLDTPTRSARRPSLNLPTSESSLRTFAVPDVATRRACAGVIPYSTSSSISRALSPCAKTPASLPLHMVTPTANAALNDCFFLVTAAGSGPCLSTIRDSSDRLGRRKRRTIRRTKARHRPKRFRCSLVSVLHRGRACLGSSSHSFGRRRMNDHESARLAVWAASFIFFSREGRGRFAVGSPPVIAVQLHPVGAVADSSRGPIPSGRWRIGPAYLHPSKGPIVMTLSPVGHVAYYRDHFLIHGDNKLGNASEGCIILGRPLRHQIASSGDAELEVVP